MSGCRPVGDGNGNRLRILRLISDSPGLTVCDISRVLGLNIGTIRYHLLILTLDHKISAFDDGEKFVRYFRNTDRYSEEDKIIISLIRREPVKRIMEEFAAFPGVSSTEVARKLGVPESAVSRYVRLLVTKKVLVKTGLQGERHAYRFSKPFVPALASQNIRC